MEPERKLQDLDRLADEPETRTILTTGASIGPYEIVSVLGEGGMGKVYRAVDNRLGRSVAIKISTQQFSTRFEREARAISALNHPNICTLFDVGSLPSGSGYMVTELVEGETLRDWLKHSPPLERRLAVIRQVIEALRAAHEAGIVHRDLKPANIMVRFDGYVKVLDFGLAKWTGRSGNALKLHDDPDSGVSVPGQIMGTVPYMSPEQILGKEADARSDLFALGIILYEMAAGRHPWSGKSSVDIMHAIVHDDAPPLNVTTSLERVIRRCLAKQLEIRFQTAAELGTALEKSVAEPLLTPPAPNQSSIAVLPFSAMTADKEFEYFGDGLAEEVINALANVSGVKVAARTSSFFFKGKDVDFAEIGRRLNVEYILEGSIRKAGNRLRVTAQLIKVANGFHLWSERYDREVTDIFALQDEITQAIAHVLRIKLSPDAASRRHVPNLRAYEAYMKARDIWFHGAQPELLSQYKELLQRAIVLDPKFALAHSFLGMYYTMQANLYISPAREVIPMAIASQEAALHVDPSLPEAHALLAVCIGGYEHDWHRAEQHWRLAMAHQPVSRDVLLWYGNHQLLPTGRTEEAIDAILLGLQGDPLNLLYRHILARALRLAGKLDDAERELRGILEINEHFSQALGTLGSIYAQQGKFEDALALTEQAYALTPWSNPLTGQLAALLVRTGARDKGDVLIERLQSDAGAGGFTALALFYAICGDLRQSAESAERAIEQREMQFVQTAGPFLCSTPYWPALAKRMNLPG